MESVGDGTENFIVHNNNNVETINHSIIDHGTLIVSCEEMERLDIPQRVALKAEPTSLKLQNNSSDNIVFCWVDFSGQLQHFRPVQTAETHVENTHRGHAFVCLRSGFDAYSQPTHISSIPSDVRASLSIALNFF